MSELLLPERPEKPLPSDCCDSGCTPCILDVYEDLVKEWEETCRRLKSGQSTSEEGKRHHTAVLLQTKYSMFKIVSIVAVTSDTNLYRFQAVEKSQDSCDVALFVDLKCQLDFKPSQYFILQGAETANDGEKFSRAYTPISDVSLSCEGCFEVLIKLYSGGKMSQFLEKLTPRAITYWRGPYGGFDYKPNTFKRIVMLCAGTGIAPLFSLAQSIVSNEEDETIVRLLFCCKDDASILLRKEIHTLRSYWNFSADIYVPYCSDHSCKPLYGETLKTARLGQDVIASESNIKTFANTMFLICGSPQFCKEMEMYLKENKVDTECIHIF